MAAPEQAEIGLDENGGDQWEFPAGYPEKLRDQRPPDPEPRILTIPQPLTDLSQEKGKGTLAGVFLPCVQSIIGIVFFYRFPELTGQAGVGYSLLILAICTTVTLLTALSMSAIATNGKVPAGGSYYMLARSLGPAFGGSAGILYFLGLASAASIYVIGAVKTFLANSDFGIISEEFDTRFLGLLAVFGLWIVNYVGLRHMSEVSMALLGSLVVALISMLVGLLSAGARTTDLPKGVFGLSGGRLVDNFSSGYEGGNSFNSVTAVFFPAMTGILAGSDRSGSLRTASRSIPLGTLAAILVTSGVYAIFIMLFGSAAERGALKRESGLSSLVAWPWPALVTACVIFNTMGEALQKTASGPPILFAISQDDLLPLGLFKTDQERSLYLTAVLSGLLVLVGDFDGIASFVTVCFLMFFAFINVACCLLSVLNNPSWRPLWPYYHWTTALAGAVLCLTVMILIAWWAALLSFILAAVLY
jgi:amino acid transporter